MVELRALSKTFNGVKAVSDLSFTVRQGEIVGLLGENGAGKTTTLRMLATMLKPTAGTATVAGHDIITAPAAVRSQIGILFGGESGLYDRLTARENITYFAQLNGMDRNTTAARVNALSVLFGMEEYIDRRVGTFSRGMRQKTALARSVVHRPAVMLFDEPTTGLDVSSSLIVQDFITRCREEKRAILFSSHKTDEIEKLCDRVIIIHQGRLLEDMSVSALLQKHGRKLGEIFLSRIGEGDA